MSCPIVEEKVWLKKGRYHTAEKNYYESLNNKPKLAVCAIFGPQKPAAEQEHCGNAIEPHVVNGGTVAELCTPTADRTGVALTSETIWLKKRKYAEAERLFYEMSAVQSRQPALSVSRPEPEVPHRGVIADHPRGDKVVDQPSPKVCDSTAPTGSPPIVKGKVWLQKERYSQAEKLFYEKVSKLLKENQDQVCNIAEVKKRTETKSKKKTSPPPVKTSPPPVKASPTPAKEVVAQSDAEPPSPAPRVLPPAEIEISVVKEADISQDVRPERLQSPHVPPSLLISVNQEEAKQFKPKESKRTKTNKKERHRIVHKDDKGNSANVLNKNSLASEVAKARQHIKNSLECIDDIAALAASNVNVDINNRLNNLEKEKIDLKKQVCELTALVGRLELRLAKLESGSGAKSSDSATTNAVKSHSHQRPPPQDDDDDGVDLFGSDSEEEDAEAARIKEQRLAEYATRKSKKPVLIAKSNIILDVKPWDDETNMKEMEAQVRKVTTDGLVWGASKLVPLAYGIHKLQISCVVEDEKVSVDWLQETIQEIEDYVQSVDIAAFNKV